MELRNVSWVILLVFMTGRAYPQSHYDIIPLHGAWYSDISSNANSATDRDDRSCIGELRRNNNPDHRPWWMAYFDREHSNYMVVIEGATSVPPSSIEFYATVSKDHWDETELYNTTMWSSTPSTTYLEYNGGDNTIFALWGVSNDAVLGFCEVTVYRCVDGWYGRFCDKPCSNRHCLNLAPCVGSGACNECEYGWFGHACAQQCNNTCDRCNKTTGECTACASNLYPVPECTKLCSERQCATSNNDCAETGGHCSPCKEGWHQYDCTRVCSRTCKRCYQQTGVCFECQSGIYSPPECDVLCEDRNCRYKNDTCPSDGSCQECIDGYYGVDCRLRCTASHCLKCEQRSGSCIECEAGWFGVDCSKKCERNCSTCQIQTGECTHCNLGMYGPEEHCNKQCETRHCREMTDCANNSCHDNLGNCPTDGRCKVGCEVGYFGADCVRDCQEYNDQCKLCNDTNCLDCESGFYIERGACHRCPVWCSTCKSNQFCTSCKRGYHGPTCNIKCPINCYGPACRKDDGICQNGCRSIFYGHYCNSTCSSSCRNQTCHDETGQCLDGCAMGKAGPYCSLLVHQPEDDNDSTGTVVAAVVVTLVVLIAVITSVLVIIRLKRRRKRKPEPNGDGGGFDSITRTDHKEPHTVDQDPTVTCYNDPSADGSVDTEDRSMTYCNSVIVKDSITAVEVSALWKYIERKKEENIFESEYEKLPSGKTLPWTHALKPTNVNKNRYRQIYAYDHSRVVLSVQDGEAGDYMNACYIDGYKRTRKYIASQGITAENIDDYWRMLWQESVEVVVMLTNIVEEGKVKCLRYWPENVGRSEMYGKIKVEFTDEDTYAEFDVKTFLVTKIGYTTSKCVKHFHFTSWPDKGVPTSAGPLINFKKRVQVDAKLSSHPIVVHCSAGIGRTGCFLAIDILVDEGHSEGYVDVFQCAMNLRKQRVDMIQTLDQYVFTHECVAEVLMFEDFIVRTVDFPDAYRALLKNDPLSNQSLLSRQYTSLQERTSEIKDFDFTSAKDANNVKKNRYRNILAADSCRPFLSTPVKGCTDYINAVILSGKKDKHGILLTQTPLPDTVVDLWRLVYEQECRTLVMMHDDNNLDETVGEYWPKKRTSSTFGPFKISSSSFLETEGCSVHTLKMTYTPFQSEREERTLKLFVCKFWPSAQSIPKAASTFLDFYRKIECWQQETGNERMVVHCMNGVDRSGLFSVLANVLQRVKLHEEVSIAPIIAQARTKRKEIISSLDQYHYCHDVVLTYLQESNVYENF